MSNGIYSYVLKRERGKQVLLLALIGVQIGVRLLPLEMQKRIINVAIGQQNLRLLLFYCGLFIGAILVSGLLKYAYSLLGSIIGENMLREFRGSIFSHIMQLPTQFFRKTSTGTLVTVLNTEVGALGGFFSEAVSSPVIGVFTLLAFAGYLFYLHPLLAAISILLFPIELTFIPYLQKKLNRLNSRRIQLSRDLSNCVQDSFSAVTEVHTNATFDYEEHKLGGWAERIRETAIRQAGLKYFTKFLSNFFASLGPFLLFLVGGYLIITGRFDVGALVAFVSTYRQLSDPWQDLLSFYQSYQDNRVRFEQVNGYMEMPSEFQVTPEDERPLHDLHGDIKAENATFVVGGNHYLLDGVDLDLNAGEHLALVGFSGSGKSTLAMVLGHLYPYHNGNIQVDHNELSQLTKADVGKNFGFVAQSPYLFNGTLLENLLYGLKSKPQGDGTSADAWVDPHSHGRESEEELYKDIFDLVRKVGFEEDLFTFGLNSPMHGNEPGLEETKGDIIGLRREFGTRILDKGRNLVEQFDPERYSEYSTLRENLLFGHTDLPDYQGENLLHSDFFRSALRETRLQDDLCDLGLDIAQELVEIFKDLSQDDPYFFRFSLIDRAEFPAYETLVERLGRGRFTGSALKEEDRRLLLKAALQYVPAYHRMAAISSATRKKVMDFRTYFRTHLTKEEAARFFFYDPDEYLEGRSLLENIIFGKILEVQNQAKVIVHELIRDLIEERGLGEAVLRQGLQFDVGHAGSYLSGGQKQKVAIMRTLLKRPNIYILDEATAALDNNSQELVQHIIDDDLADKTLIAVAHRISTIRNFSKIAVLKAGKIIEIGTYDELMAREGAFYELSHSN